MKYINVHLLKNQVQINRGSSVPNRSAGPNKQVQVGEFLKINKHAVQNKFAGETSYEKSSNVQDLIFYQRL